jgi:hypothetical protein
VSGDKVACEIGAEVKVVGRDAVSPDSFIHRDTDTGRVPIAEKYSGRWNANTPSSDEGTLSRIVSDNVVNVVLLHTDTEQKAFPVSGRTHGGPWRDSRAAEVKSGADTELESCPSTRELETESQRISTIDPGDRSLM